MDKKIKHLEMIQGVISRMTRNSFMLKGWAVTLVTGIFALAGKEAEELYFFVTYIPIIVFWTLDAYYLCQERLYRGLYEKVRTEEESKIDFSLTASQNEFGDAKNKYIACLMSTTEAGFYLPLALACTGIIIVIHCV